MPVPSGSPIVLPQQPNPFSDFFETMLRVMSMKAQQDAQREQIKIQKERLKLEEEQARREAATATDADMQAIQALLGAAGSNEPALQQMIAPAVQSLGNANVPSSLALSQVRELGTQPSATTPSRLGATTAQIARERSRQQLLARFPENLRHGVGTILALREQAELPADFVNDIASRLLPETEMQKLDRLIKIEQEKQARLTTTVARENLLRLRRDTEMRRRFASLLDMDIETLPDSVIDDLIRAAAPEKFKNPQDMAFQLAKSLATAVVMDPATGVARPAFSISEIATRTDDVMRFLTEGDTGVHLTDKMLATAALESMALQAILNNAGADRRMSKEQLRSQFLEAAQADPAFSGLSPAEIAQAYNEAVRAAGIHGVF